MPPHGDIPITAYFPRQTAKNPGKRRHAGRDGDDDAYPPPAKYAKVSGSSRQATAKKAPKTKQTTHSKRASSPIDLTQESQPAVIQTPRRPLVQLNHGLATPHPFDLSLDKHLPTASPAQIRDKRLENPKALPTPVSLGRVGKSSKVTLLKSPGTPSVASRSAKPITVDAPPPFPLLQRSDALFKKPLTPIHTSSLSTSTRDEIVPSSQSDEMTGYFGVDDVTTSPTDDAWGDEVIPSSQLHERDSYQFPIPSSQPDEHYRDPLRAKTTALHFRYVYLAHYFADHLTSSFAVLKSFPKHRHSISTTVNQKSRGRSWMWRTGFRLPFNPFRSHRRLSLIPTTMIFLL